MDETSKTLLARARKGDDSAWRRLVDVYQPLIRGWILQQGVHAQEAEDLTQDVLAIMVRELGLFEHNGRIGAFRNWLRTVTVNRERAFLRAGKCRAQTAGGASLLSQLEELEDPNSLLSRRWDEEHDRHVLRRLMELMEQEFTPPTIAAFRRLTFEGAAAADVARELQLSMAAVYAAKSRVLRRLREEAEGLID